MNSDATARWENRIAHISTRCAGAGEKGHRNAVNDEIRTITRTTSYKAEFLRIQHAVCPVVESDGISLIFSTVISFRVPAWQDKDESE